MAVLELSGVWKSYGPVEVLRGVDLGVDEGEFVSVRGRSGVGKTTLLRIAGLLETPDRGEVVLLGREVGRLGDGERSALRLHYIGFVPQLFGLIPTLTVLENVELPMALAGVGRRERRERALELLSYFGIERMASRFPRELSAGEAQRVAIARALANRPRLVLADEPTSNLDEESAALVVELLARVSREEGVAVVMTTIDLHEGLPTTRDYVLRDGRLSPLRPHHRIGDVYPDGGARRRKRDPESYDVATEKV